MDIFSKEIIINQLPSKDNGFVAICSARVTLLNGQIFSNMGIANGSVENNYEDALIVAEQNAFNNAMQSAIAHASTAMSSNNPTSYQNHGKQKSSSNSITVKQKRLIETTAMHNSQSWDDAQNVSQQIYGKPIEALNTKEVNAILDELRFNGGK